MRRTGSKTPLTGGEPGLGTVRHFTRAAPQVRQPYAAARVCRTLETDKMHPFLVLHAHSLQTKIRYVARFGLRVLFHFVQRPRQK